MSTAFLFYTYKTIQKIVIFTSSLDPKESYISMEPCLCKLLCNIYMNKIQTIIQRVIFKMRNRNTFLTIKIVDDGARTTRICPSKCIHIANCFLFPPFSHTGFPEFFSAHFSGILWIEIIFKNSKYLTTNWPYVCYAHLNHIPQAQFSTKHLIFNF